jgi:hypothetical protein
VSGSSTIKMDGGCEQGLSTMMSTGDEAGAAIGLQQDQGRPVRQLPST